jgi:hypothetical protein
MIETRTALGRLFVLLAIVTIPKAMMPGCSALFEIDDKLKAARKRQKARHGGRKS